MTPRQPVSRAAHKTESRVGRNYCGVHYGGVRDPRREVRHSTCGRQPPHRRLACEPRVSNERDQTRTRADPAARARAGLGRGVRAGAGRDATAQLHRWAGPAGLHEFIVFGFSPELARPVLGDLAQRARDGERFPTSVGLEDVLPGMPAVLLDVPSVEADHYLPAARDCAPMNLRALQIVWPDGRDLFPWQDGYDETFRGRQIVLHPFARTGGRR